MSKLRKKVQTKINAFMTHIPVIWSSILLLCADLPQTGLHYHRPGFSLTMFKFLISYYIILV